MTLCVCVCVFVILSLQYPPQVSCKGNLLLSRLAGATVIICPPLKDLGNVIEKQIDLMEEYAVKLR